MHVGTFFGRGRGRGREAEDITLVTLWISIRALLIKQIKCTLSTPNPKQKLGQLIFWVLEKQAQIAKN